jgi:hypothetical protein
MTIPKKRESSGISYSPVPHNARLQRRGQSSGGGTFRPEGDAGTRQRDRNQVEKPRPLEESGDHDRGFMSSHRIDVIEPESRPPMHLVRGIADQEVLTCSSNIALVPLNGTTFV